MPVNQVNDPPRIVRHYSIGPLTGRRVIVSVFNDGVYFCQRHDGITALDITCSAKSAEEAKEWAELQLKAGA